MAVRLRAQLVASCQLEAILRHRTLKFDDDVSWCRFLWGFCLSFTQLLESTDLRLLPNLGSFHLFFFFKVFFSPTIFLLSFWNTADRNIIRSLFTVLQVLKALFFFLFFQAIFPLLFRMDISLLSDL